MSFCIEGPVKEERTTRPSVPPYVLSLRESDVISEWAPLCVSSLKESNVTSDGPNDANDECSFHFAFISLSFCCWSSKEKNSNEQLRSTKEGMLQMTTAIHR